MQIKELFSTDLYIKKFMQIKMEKTITIILNDIDTEKETYNKFQDFLSGFVGASELKVKGDDETITND